MRGKKEMEIEEEEEIEDEEEMDDEEEMFYISNVSAIIKLFLKLCTQKKISIFSE